MSHPGELENHVKRLRISRGWSQAELARRAGISRAAVSAVEIERLVPSVAAALSLAGALGCRVDALFAMRGGAGTEPAWAWPAAADPCRFWQAEVAGRVLYFPVEGTGLGAGAHDGVCEDGVIRQGTEHIPENTLVMASCDPAASLLAAELARSSPFRLIVFPRSSSAALDLLAEKLIHVAGVHLTGTGRRQGNAAAVRQKLGPGYTLLHVARWQEGLAIAPERQIESVGGALRKNLRWVGREPGSGARECLDELLENRQQPRRQARDHRGVAEAIRCGWADVGVCVRLVSEEAGLKFLSVRGESYDLCFAGALSDDPRLKALIATVRSEPYRRLLGELPGYDARRAGELEKVD